jgi:Mrp family chromosome partitioning ATPase/capsular polysaccharide biosynthesis protein
MPLNSTRPLSPSIISALSRFRRVVIAFVALFVFSFALYALVSGPTYAGKAAIVITQPPSSLHPFFGNGSTTTPAAYIEKQVALLESQSVSNSAAAIVNHKIPGAHVTGQEINGHLTVKPQTGVAAGLSPTTNVTVTNGNAEIAAASANAILQSYVTASHLLIHQQANQSVAALNKQIAKTQGELNQLPAPTASTTTTTVPVPKTPTVPATPRTTTTRAQRTTTTRAPRTTTTTTPKTTTTKAQDTTTTTTSASATGAVRNSSHSELASFQFGAAQPPSHIMLVDTTSTTAVGGTTTTAAASGNTGGTGNTGNTGSGSSSHVAQRAALTNSLILLSKSKTQVQVDEQADLQASMVVYPASIPTKPTTGSFWKYVGLGLLLGLVVGAIVAYALAYTRQVFEKPEEPELLYDIPMLAVIPAFRQPAWLPTGLPILTEPFDEPAEQYRVIATALRSIRNSHMSMLIAFSAAAPRSGTTTTVANTGLALAEMGERILVIDGDPVGRGLTRTLLETDLEHPIAQSRPGFSEVLGGRPLMDTVAQAETNPNLFVLGCGLDPDLALSRWSSQAIRLAMDDAKDQFDLVLIDVPPVGTSYGIDLARASQNLVLVVPYLDPVRHHTQLKERLEIAGISLLSYVFNGIPATGEFISYYPLLHSTGNGLPEAEPVPISSAAVALSGTSRSTAMTPGTSMSANATTTVVREGDTRGADESGLLMRDDDTWFVPSVPSTVEAETPEATEPVTGQLPIQGNEPTTQQVQRVEDIEDPS